jgi:uncharacterized membrane protein
MENQKCSISGQSYPANELVRAGSLRPQLFAFIQKHHKIDENSLLGLASLNDFRRMYLEDLIKKESHDLGRLEKEVVNAIHDQQLLSSNLDEEMQGKRSLGDRVADSIAEFGGSWTFIISFFSFLLVWMAINIWVLSTKPFDPYPFILLNLILSCLAAIQAPIIMMSQNRQELKDRSRNEHDYQVNLKAELEIRILHEKIDHLILHQNKRLLEIQELQLDYLEELAELRGKGANPQDPNKSEQ